MKIYMVKHNNLEHMAVSENGSDFFIPNIIKDCPEQYKTVDNYLNYI